MTMPRTGDTSATQWYYIPGSSTMDGQPKWQEYPSYANPGGGWQPVAGNGLLPGQAAPDPTPIVTPVGTPVTPNPLTQTNPEGQPITNFPAPPGYAWSINPTDGTKVLIDLTPLDQSQPLSGWHWAVTDPAVPNVGTWVFTPDREDLADPFEGVPKSMFPWLSYALNQGGSLDNVPDAAKAWVSYLMTRATDPGQQGGHGGDVNTQKDVRTETGPQPAYPTPLTTM